MDRFGETPKSVENLLRISLIRAHAHRLYITELKGKNESLQMVMRPDAPIRVENIPALLANYGGKMSFDPKGAPTFRLRYRKCGMMEKDEEMLLTLTEDTLDQLEHMLLDFS